MSSDLGYFIHLSIYGFSTPSTVFCINVYIFAYRSVILIDMCSCSFVLARNTVRILTLWAYAHYLKYIFNCSMWNVWFVRVPPGFSGFAVKPRTDYLILSVPAQRRSLLGWNAFLGIQKEDFSRVYWPLAYRCSPNFATINQPQFSQLCAWSLSTLSPETDRIRLFPIGYSVWFFEPINLFL